MKPVLRIATEQWHPKTVRPPIADPEFIKMNGLQRVVESLRYISLCWEHWVAPDGTVREWLRHNTRLGAWLLTPAICVMPVVGFILWQLTGWLSMLTVVAGKLIVLPILILLAFVVIKTAVALLKR